MNDARTEVLTRVAAAVLDSRPSPEFVRLYRRIGTLDAPARLSLFCDRVSEYRADVRRVSSDGISEAITDVCSERGAVKVAAPRGLPKAWRPEDFELIYDNGLTSSELNSIDGTVTGCTTAIAETGTIVLAAGPRDGRRILSLIPDLHICIVEEYQVVELLPEAIATLESVMEERRPLTFVSGPSATSDIELTRVEGVHGPRNLVVLVASHC